LEEERETLGTQTIFKLVLEKITECTNGNMTHAAMSPLLFDFGLKVNTNSKSYDQDCCKCSEDGELRSRHQPFAFCIKPSG